MQWNAGLDLVFQAHFVQFKRWCNQHFYLYILYTCFFYTDKTLGWKPCKLIRTTGVINSDIVLFFCLFVCFWGGSRCDLESMYVCLEPISLTLCFLQRSQSHIQKKARGRCFKINYCRGIEMFKGIWKLSRLLLPSWAILSQPRCVGRGLLAPYFMPDGCYIFHWIVIFLQKEQQMVC